ncbi:hypothetical protein OH76DRAFT_147346 [Lentinus brumalis]|uniref:Uncharacterized protein n=1 Tax=Lentinus brumalis TaxID=2498619 RepID=A0A371CPC6_9APHY|nr:hypothetical protein OH76DRAFT_147346 [Polyporus brumalis]
MAGVRSRDATRILPSRRRLARPRPRLSSISESRAACHVARRTSSANGHGVFGHSVVHGCPENWTGSSEVLLVSGLQTVQSPIYHDRPPPSRMRHLLLRALSWPVCQPLHGACASRRRIPLAAWCLVLIVHSDNERAIACPEQDPVNRARRARKRAQITGSGARSRLTRGAAEELAWRLRGFGGFASRFWQQVSRRARAHPRAKESRTRYICCTPNVEARG